MVQSKPQMTRISCKKQLNFIHIRYVVEGNSYSSWSAIGIIPSQRAVWPLCSSHIPLHSSTFITLIMNSLNNMGGHTKLAINQLDPNTFPQRSPTNLVAHLTSRVRILPNSQILNLIYTKNYNGCCCCSGTFLRVDPQDHERSTCK